MARKRIRTKVTGLVAHVTPNANRNSKYKSDLSVAMLAYSNGEATEEQMQLIHKSIMHFKDARLSAPTRIRRGIPAQKMTILGKTFELTREDIAEFKEWEEKVARMHEDKSLELLISEDC